MEVSDQLINVKFASEELAHPKVEAAVKVLVVGHDGFLPKFLSLLDDGFSFRFKVEVLDAGKLIQNVGFLSHERVCESVVLVEVFFKVLDQQLAQVAQLALRGADSCQLYALQEHLDQR